MTDTEIVPGDSISLKYEPPEDAFAQPFNMCRFPKNEPPVSHRFFVQYLQARIAAIPAADDPPHELRAVFKLISSTWSLALTIYDEADLIRSHVGNQFMTDEKIIDDSTVMIESMVLLMAPKDVELQTRVMARFYIHVSGEGTNATYDIDVTTHVGYGMLFNTAQMAQVIKDHIRGEDGRLQIKDWRLALVALKQAVANGEIEHDGVAPAGRAPTTVRPQDKPTFRDGPSELPPSRFGIISKDYY